MESTLSSISPGSHFVVSSVRGRGVLRKRLLDLGFVMGAQGLVLRRGLFGGPVLLKLGRDRIALRGDEARALEVTSAHG